MEVAIVTRGRGPERQYTADALRGVSFVVRTFCHPQDLAQWPDFKAIPVEHDWVYEVRQHILNTCDKVIMLDDDFANWSHIRPDGRYTKATTAEIEETFKEIDEMLNTRAVVGIGQRYMANTRPLVVVNGRVNGAIGINCARLRQLGVSFRRKTMEDFDLILQLLTKGEEVVNYSRLVYEQASSGTDGGCSTYRTLELHNEGALELAKQWPGLVRVVEKTTKGSWGGGTRLDVVVSWKKAYANANN